MSVAQEPSVDDTDYANGEYFVICEEPLPAGTYEQIRLVIEESTIPDTLEVTAHTQDGEIMGVRHRTLPIEGVQFHPESILTDRGKDLIRNFLDQS